MSVRASLFSASLLARHQLAAVAATVVDFGVMIALVELARTSPPLSTFCSALIGGVTNFTLSRTWAYRRAHEGSVTSQGIRYAVVSCGGALLNAVLLGGVLRMLAFPYTFVRAGVAVLVSVFYTYPMHTRVVFRVRR